MNYPKRLIYNHYGVSENQSIYFLDYFERKIDIDSYIDFLKSECDETGENIKTLIECEKDLKAVIVR